MKSMKNWLKMFAAMAIAVTAMGCMPTPEEPTEPQLEVTPNNIAGVWMLSTWQGAELAEGSFVYIDFVRQGRTYTIYQNVDSSVVRKITGEYNIYTNKSGQVVLRGTYDYTDSEEWTNRYVVESLTATKMKLVVFDAADSTKKLEESLYVRTELPEELVGL